MSKQIFETIQQVLKKVLRIPETRAKIGEGSLPKAKNYRAVSPASQPPPEISINLPLKTEPLAHQYLFERVTKGTLDPTVFPDNQKALDLSKKVEYYEEKWKVINARYGFDARNIRNWWRYRERTVDEGGIPLGERGHSVYNTVIDNKPPVGHK